MEIETIKLGQEERLMAELSVKDTEIQDLNDMIEIKDQDLRQIEEEIDQYQQDVQDKDSQIEALNHNVEMLKQMLKDQTSQTQPND